MQAMADKAMQSESEESYTCSRHGDIGLAVMTLWVKGETGFTHTYCVRCIDEHLRNLLPVLNKEEAK